MKFKKNESNQGKKPFYKKWWFIVIVVFIAIGALMGGGDEEDQTEIASNEPEIVEESTEAQEPLDLEGFVTKTIHDKLGEQTNMKKDTIVYIDSSSNVLDIALNANDNFSNKMMITGMHSDSKKLYEALVQDERVMEFDSISIIYQMTLLDQLGNEKDGNVMIIDMSTDTLSNVNWTNFSHDNFPNVAETYFLHPALRD